MQHPADNETEIMLSVTEQTQIPANVVSSALNPVDGAYHYDLQCTMTDGNNVNSVQVNDVHQSLVILPNKED